VNSRALAWIAFLAAALAPSLASAATTCSFTGVPGMGFGTYNDSSASPTDSTTSVVVNCARSAGPADTTVVLQIGPSATSGSNAPRQMASGANRMNYNLYRDSGRSQVWGQSAGVDTSGVTIIGIPNNGAKSGTIVIYGRIPAQQNVAAGAYSDTVQLTISP
jgi:spore coat protein U-like protein